MQVTVTAGCGHTTTVNLQGPVKQREQRIAWMQSPSGKCNACYARMKEAEVAESERQAAAQLAKQITAQYNGNPPADVIATLRAQAAQRPGSTMSRRLLAAFEILGI